FSENGVHLYAGRTKRKIGARVKYHFNNTARDCPFAWLLARELTGKPRTYTRKGSRKALLSDPSFAAEYQNAKSRIRNMQVRYVHEPDSWNRALLEIYTSIAAGAKYNDFTEV